jgi:hypothetical protein
LIIGALYPLVDGAQLGVADHSNTGIHVLTGAPRFFKLDPDFLQKQRQRRNEKWRIAQR